MGEGPKDVRNDDSRWDVTRSDDVTGRGEGDVVGRPMADTPGVTSATGYAGGIPPAETVVPPTTAASGMAGTTPPGIGTGYTGSATGGTTDDTSQIRAQIEQSRANITDTVEEITNRLSPRNIAADATEATRERVRHFADTAGERAREIAVQTRHATDRAVDTARENPWVTAMAVAGIGAAAWWLMSRHDDDVSEYDVDYYTEESLYYDDIDDDIVNEDERVERMDSSRTMGVAVPLVLAGIGVGAWLFNRQSGRHESYGSGSPLGASQNSWGDVGYGEEAGSYRSFEGAGSSWGDEASSAADRARGTVSDTAGKARDAVSDAAGRARGAVSEAAGRARHAANDAAERARHAASDVGDRTRGMAIKARRQVGQAGQRAKGQLEHWMDDNPLACGAVAMAVGVAVGLAVPESRREHHLMGNTRDRLMGRAQAAASGAVDRAKGAAREAVDAAKEAAGEAMDKSKESAQSAVSDIQRDMTKA